MERESFENPDIARIMNANFVNVKVDREERPDVDKVYMTFVTVRLRVHACVCVRFIHSLGDTYCPFDLFFILSPHLGVPSLCIYGVCNRSLMEV